MLIDKNCRYLLDDMKDKSNINKASWLQGKPTYCLFGGSNFTIFNLQPNDEKTTFFDNVFFEVEDNGTYGLEIKTELVNDIDASKWSKNTEFHY